VYSCRNCLRQLNIVDVQAETNLSDYDRDFLSASKARELSVLSDIDSGVGNWFSLEWRCGLFGKMFVRWN
jgi:hypothetical protein